jgi:PST family polysaccharide transporter
MMGTSEERFEQYASTQRARADLRKRSVSGAVFTALSGGGEIVLRLFSTLVLARLLLPEHFGLVAMVLTVTSLAEQFAGLGLSTATVQAGQVTQAQCSNLFWINAAAGGALALMTALCAPLIATFYTDSRLVVIALVMSSNFVFAGLSIQHEALLARRMEQPRLAANRLTANLASSLLAIALAIGGYEYWALAWRDVSRGLFTAAGLFCLCPWVPSLPKRGAGISPLLRVGRDMTGTQVLVAVMSRLDALLVGKFAGPVVLGLYRQASNLIAQPIDQLNAPIFSVSQPALSMLQEDPERYRRYYARLLFVVALVTMPVGAFTVVYAPEIVGVVLGENWSGAVIFLQLFGAAAIVRPVVGTTSAVMVTSGNSYRFFMVTLVQAIVVVVFTALGIVWGAVGVALAQVAASVLLVPWKLRYSFFETPVNTRLFLNTVTRPFIASLVTMAAIAPARYALAIDNQLMSLVAGTVAAALLYCGFLSCLPGGRQQLSSLFQEVFTLVRKPQAALEDVAATS